MLLGKAVFLVTMILTMVIRYPYRKGRSRHKDRQEQLLLILLSIGGLLLPLVFIFTDWLAFADYNPPFWVIAAGVLGGLLPPLTLLSLLALPLAVRATVVLLRHYEERALVAANAATIKLHLVAGLLMAAGIV